MTLLNLKDVIVSSAHWLNAAIAVALWVGGVVITVICVAREFGARRIHV